ncbi:NAD(P)/FAD-dependent oxidoreductase [Streptomyces flavalbus]|uniref:NAD(P)/FAD-dependent oxidoreductase n=1 Tax=Streptomyces flavalbus TaxID=2665155 RepID=A0ABW2W5P4_9ACTN
MSRRAVVIGAGMGGLLAAAALSTTVDEVTVLDRDAMPEGPEHRRGVPQGRHAHLLLAGGLDAIGSLFPDADVRKHLLAAGAHEISLSSGVVALTPEGWLHRWRRPGPHLLTCSRALLDWAVRDLVTTHTATTFHQGTVTSLLGTADRVTGVVVDDSTHLPADLVVDASGRGSRTTTWLSEVGISHIRERTVDSGLVNATRVYRVPPGAERFPLTVVHANPHLSRPGRSGMVLPIEGDRWMVSLAGTRGAEPPADPDGFLRYTLDLPDPIVGRLISGAEPLTGVHVSRSTSNVRRYFEKAPRWPEGFVALGDAVATFNPAYGQGMSVAALGAQTLAHEVRHSGPAAPGLSRRVQRGVARSVETAWSAAVSQDVLYPATLGGHPRPADRLITAYSRRLMHAATGSYKAASVVWDAMSMRGGPTRVLHPDALLAALTGPLLGPPTEAPLTPGERKVLAALDRT